MKSKSKKRGSLILAFLFVVLNHKAQTIFYTKSTGNMNVLTTWGTNTDGSGAAPVNFTTANRIYMITNRVSATLGAAWVVSGAGSKVQLGDGISGVELIIPSIFALTGTIDVTANGS